MAIGFDGTRIMTVSCVKMPSGAWGITYIRYDVGLKASSSTEFFPV